MSCLLPLLLLPSFAFTFLHDFFLSFTYYVYSEVAQSCPTLCNPMDCSLPGSSVHGIFQARVLEWIAISFSRGSSNPGIETGASALEADTLPSEPPGKSSIMYVYTVSAEKAMATHSSTLAWKIPWTEEPARLQSMGSLRVGHNWATSLSRIGEVNGNPLQCSRLENPRDGGAWWAAVYGVAQRQTRLKRLSSSSSILSQY